MTNGPSVQVDVDKLCGGGKTGCSKKRQHGICPGANDQHKVCLTKGHRPSRGKSVGMIFRNDSPSLRGREKKECRWPRQNRRSSALAPTTGYRCRSRPAVSRLGQEFNGLFDKSGVSSRPASTDNSPASRFSLRQLYEPKYRQVNRDTPGLSCHPWLPGRQY